MLVDVQIEDADPDEEVEVLELHVDVGSKVSAGEALMEVATDKANMDVAAPIDGVVEELRVAAGDTVNAASVLAVLRDG